MLAAILGFLIVGVVTYIYLLVEKPKEKFDWRRDFCYEGAGFLGIVFLILSAIAVPFVTFEKVPHTDEIVSVGGQFFDESRNAEGAEIVYVYVKDGKDIEKKQILGGLNEVKYEGTTAKVDYVEYKSKPLGRVCNFLLFPSSITQGLLVSAEGATITLPET